MYKRQSCRLLGFLLLLRQISLVSGFSATAALRLSYCLISFEYALPRVPVSHSSPPRKEKNRTKLRVVKGLSEKFDDERMNTVDLGGSVKNKITVLLYFVANLNNSGNKLNLILNTFSTETI